MQSNGQLFLQSTGGGGGHLVGLYLITVVVVVEVYVTAIDHRSACKVSKSCGSGVRDTLRLATLSRFSLASFQLCRIVIRWYSVDHCGEEHGKGKEPHVECIFWTVYLVFKSGTDGCRKFAQQKRDNSSYICIKRSSNAKAIVRNSGLRQASNSNAMSQIQ